MSLDEGFTWAVAGQPVSRLLQIQPLFDSGKLAVYGLLLHYWIEIFGDSLRSMRGLSGAIDTLSILLMFAVVRELYQVFANGELQTGELAGGFAAFIFATNVAVVQSARTARMYPLMTAAELAQIFFFVRSQRHGGALNCILTSVFIALAIATNFTAAFILLSEALWLAYLLIARRRELAGADLHVAGPVLALMGGLGLLLPWMSAATILMRGTTRYRDFGWIVYRPPMYWSYEVLRGNAGNKSLFRLFLALAAFGLWRHRSWAPLVPMFMAVAAVGPFVAVAVASLFGIPMMVDRYVLIAVIAFLGLAAIGAASFESKLGQALVFALIVRLSVQALRHSSAFLVDWKKAVAMACAESAADAEIGVVPGYAVDVVRYHLPLQRRPFAVGLDSQCGNSQILIVNPGRFIPQAYMSKLNACYPRLLGRATRVEVRSR
ncbi:MAG: glycosyltransferase family 39 protein [Deltaproteobacteria bacterium]|nr:glycosyltransferase family 39 protein [Deltaproteobacteria bacterium]